MTTALITATGQPYQLKPATANKDSESHLKRYNAWTAQTGQPLTAPDLAAYRDHLLKDLAPVSVSAHLSSIRAAYRVLCRNRDIFYSTLPDELIITPTDTPTDKATKTTAQKAWVDESIQRIQDATHPDSCKVAGIVKVQDTEDSKHVRLTTAQANAYMAAYGVDSLRGLRDTALIAFALCTGLREFELCALTVDDLRQTGDGLLACRVNEGKGCKKRLVYYGDMSWVLVIVDKWLQKAGIDSGYVFRGFYKGNKRIRPNGLTPRQVQRITKTQPVNIDGQLVEVRPHDLRRTYARRLKDSGMDVLAIRDQLGHADHKTTELYIGEMDASDRQPASLYTFDLSQL